MGELTLPDRNFVAVRVAHPDLELVRGGDGRTVHGIAVPWNSPSRVADPGTGVYEEVFLRGSFEHTIRSGGAKVKFLVNHNKLAAPIGVATLLREDAIGLYTELRVSQTREGDDALELIRDGALDSFSVGFKPIRPDWPMTAQLAKRGQTVERREVALREISAVSFPSYTGAAILGVRTDHIGTSTGADDEAAQSTSGVTRQDEAVEQAAQRAVVPTLQQRIQWRLAASSS